MISGTHRNHRRQAVERAIKLAQIKRERNAASLQQRINGRIVSLDGKLIVR